MVRWRVDPSMQSITHHFVHFSDRKGLTVRPVLRPKHHQILDVASLIDWQATTLRSATFSVITC